ncbi:LamG-like jellyroll fold domain-containing protein [Pedobacter nyackensis]|uniref:Type I phosphodiesterase / nucleotide pyrophosphatase n=1 Tax=Pedobacter nyackensis TaxID=475255 RepID=A0A1W2CPU9_9SPHI|nr:LamG-like jellyroll fold domain-containing protein [Pedobacter nyackensis]SMC87285.1 Type I phosphodiesterase / nucleotide pyrophosphatase [Pedobacter nyackensis]
MKTSHYIYKNIKSSWFCIGLLAILGACNSPFERMIPEREYTDSANVAFSKPKVLYIIVDGARGTSVRNAQASNINSLLPASIYTWNGLSDIDASTNAANYASMLTGVKALKHGVKSDDFSGNHLADFPVLFKRIKETDPTLRTVVFTSSPLLKSNLCDGTTLSTQLSDDIAVKSAVVNDLEKEASSVVVAQFSGIDEAGKSSGYDLSFPAYKAAILKFDGYVGEMLTALKKRPNYKSEKWLVVISSSKGGTFTLPASENDNTIFSKPEFNTFTIFYNAGYSTRILSKPYLGSSFPGTFLKFTGNLRALNPAGDNSIYNFGDSEFTIELKVKKNALNFTWPSLIGKRKDWVHGEIGWNIFLENAYWVLNARGVKSGAQQIKGADMPAGTWNSIAVVCYYKAGKRYIRTFTNGKFNNEADITALGVLDNNFPLTLGKFPSNGSMDGYISDVKIWKAAFSDEKMAQFSCDTYVDPGHPYYDYLISYWPMLDGAGNSIKDEGIAKNNLTVQDGTVTWGKLSDLLCSPPATNLALLVPGAIDIPAQIYSWLRIPRQESWLLDGRVWQDQ